MTTNDEQPEQQEGEDTYLSIAAIAGDTYMNERVRACYAQQTDSGSGNAEDPASWSWNNRYDWASAPGWGSAWEYAINSGNTEPGKDPSVITDLMILNQVQQMLGLLRGDEG